MCQYVIRCESDFYRIIGKWNLDSLMFTFLMKCFSRFGQGGKGFDIRSGQRNDILLLIVGAEQKAVVQTDEAG